MIETETFAGAAAPWPWGANTASTGKTMTAYVSLAQTEVTDPDMVTRRNIFDSLGRLVEVVEDPSGQNLSTRYTYDTRDSLLTVEQKNAGGVDRARTFEYSSLGRLIQATNPESEKVKYDYDNNGNLTVKTELEKAASALSTVVARGVLATMSYDALNRVTTKTYSGNKTVTYGYDTGCPYGWGRVCTVSNEAAVRSYQYDVLGRATQSTQQMGTDSYVTKYQYNLADGVTEVEYPSSTASNPKKVGYGYTAAGRVAEVYKGAVGAVGRYVTGAQYFAGGATKGQTLGNGAVETTGLDSGLRVKARSVATGGVTVWRMDNVYANNGNVRAGR